MRNYLILAALVSLLASSCSVFKTREELAREQDASEVKQSVRETVQGQAEQITELQAEQTQLLGRVDELEHRLKQGQANNEKNQATEMQEIQNRLQALEESQKQLLDQMKALQESRIQELQNQEPAAKSGKAKGKSKGHSFEDLQKLMKNKNYEQALPGLQQYVKEHPSGKNHLTASSLLGEAQYNTGDYSGAILSFSDVQEKSPTSNQGRKATLRIAESFRKLGKKKEAKTFAQLLVDKFPDSDEAKKAKPLLK